MLNRILAVWFWFGSDRPGFCLGTSSLIALMLLMYTGGIQASLSLGPGGDFPRVRDVFLYAFSHDELTSLLPGPLCRRRGGKSDLWLLCHPASALYSAVSSGVTEEAEVFASLVSPLASSVDWSSAAAGDPCSASLLHNIYRTQLSSALYWDVTGAGGGLGLHS